MAESTFGDISDNKKNSNQNFTLASKNPSKNSSQNNQVRISSVQNFSIMEKLKAVALTLPFNLFNMNPIKSINITNLPYPFALEFQRPKLHE